MYFRYIFARLKNHQIDIREKTIQLFFIYIYFKQNKINSKYSTNLWKKLKIILRNTLQCPKVTQLPIIFYFFDKFVAYFKFIFFYVVKYTTMKKFRNTKTSLVEI